MKAVTADPLNPALSQKPDVPASLAFLLGVAFLALLYWIHSPRQAMLTFTHAAQFVELNVDALGIVAGATFANVIWISWYTKFKKPDPKRDVLHRDDHLAWRLVISSLGLIAFIISRKYFELRHTELLSVTSLEPYWSLFSTVALTGLGILPALLLRAMVRRLPTWFSFLNTLPRVPVISDAIILGAVHERVSDDDKDPQKGLSAKKTDWIKLGLKALTGNLFVTGVIGSGKSQILLQLLKQVLGNLKSRPALLAIDPKRTFVRELRRNIDQQKLTEHLLWIELGGKVKFNPIWRPKLLKDSAFTTVANTLKLASINFLGSSPDNRFWEQSSFNLLKNSLIFCAAQYDYFTFKELYQALILARDEGLAAKLVDSLNTKTWDEEERANIEMAIAYFRDEFSQMDQKIRTSILATATSFLNEFLEYSVSQILSPKREEITLQSIADAIRDGKLICLHIEHDALARSIGTLFKLLFQEAVLARVADPNHSTARYAVLVMDEYQDVATSGGGAGLGDDRYLAKARESKAITIAATQSVSSLENAIRSEAATREILQNFRNRLLGNTTDPRTVKLFQEPMGTIEVEKRSQSRSESSKMFGSNFLGVSQGARPSGESESTSIHYVQEFPVTAREFSRLRTFESYAQIFDGLETRFEKVFLKPYFLKDMRTSHAKLLKMMRANIGMLLVFMFGLLRPEAQAGVLFPNICTVVQSSSFLSCLGFSVAPCLCGFPPRPCAQMSYYVPQTFIEVWPNSKDSFFTMHPAQIQLKAHIGSQLIPFGTDDELDGYSFQAHAIAVPLANEIFKPLPCQGTRMDKPCFDALSEDMGDNWSTGKADALQPNFLAWSLSPKACIIKGAVQSAVGEVVPSLGFDVGGCSTPLGAIPIYPPSTREACNGWGTFYPRSGHYQGGSRSGAALMIASRLKSLGTEMLHTVPGDPDEVWQMIYPQSSSCFKEGKNLGSLELLEGMREESRLGGKPNGYLFVVWKKVSCCQDIPMVAEAAASLAAIAIACQIVPGGT